MEGSGVNWVFLRGGTRLRKIIHRDFAQMVLWLADLVSAQRERAPVVGLQRAYRI
jgi:hypothetical protein